MLVTGGGCLKKLIEETVFSKILAVWLWRQVLNKFSPDQFTIHDFNNTNLKFTRLNFKNTNPKFTRRNLYFCNFKNTNPKFTRRYLYFLGENNPPTQVCVWKIHTPLPDWRYKCTMWKNYTYTPDRSWNCSNTW